MTGFPSDGDSIATERLTLTALTVHDADEMVGVLNDERLHAFIGGRPDTITELRDRYRRFVAGPKESDDVWLNWIVRSTQDGAAVGTVQATVSTLSDGRTVAAVAWVIGIAWQGRGYASEAARALIDWLRAHGVDQVTAHIRPDHHASATVARRSGLHETDELINGETVWRLTCSAPRRR
jgi:RimJ/RimL family protein N-acetyltransferase